MENNIILGTAFNYSWKEINNFLCSLHEKYTGVVVLFSNTKFRFDSFSFTLIIEHILYDNQTYKFPVDLNNSNNYRYFFYQQYLRQNPGYEFVMMADVRDVIFQKNPFHDLEKNILHVALEENIIRNCQYNSNWISALFGKEYLTTLLNETVICSGTTIGSGNTLTKYLQEIVDLTVIHGKRLDTGNNNMIIDQALHIYWCLNNLPLIRKHENSDGYLFTMGYATSFCINREGEIINTKKEPYSIVHQYDRFPIIQLFFEKKYNSVNNVKKTEHSFYQKIRKRLRLEQF